MKLNKSSLFLIILISLFLGMLTHRLVEGMTNPPKGHSGDTSPHDGKPPHHDGKPPHHGSDSPDHTHHGNSTPSGVHKSQIPDGEEDLYILKSQIVPPVCPACPQNTSCPREKPPPPCPPCARCPETPFECKKVPNYKSSNQQYLPKPMLTDFSQF